MNTIFKKLCPKCGEEKPLSEFNKDKYTKSGYRCHCIDCNRKYANIYRHKNKKKIAKYKREYELKNKDKIKEYYRQYNLKNKIQVRLRNKQYWIKNKDKIFLRQKRWREKNKEKQSIHMKEYRKKNKKHISFMTKKYKNKHKEKYKKYNTEYSRNYRNINIQAKIKNLFGTRVRMILNGTSKSLSTMFLVGCEIDYLMYHLQCQFKPGMNWDNHGSGKRGKGMKEWHIDHIKPCASFDLSKTEEQQKCFHYTNLQPLWAKENLQKSNKYTE